MAKKVNHEERKKEILAKSLPLFSKFGYPPVTYQQIADVCGISRTVLYRYFPTKRDIFDAALLQLTTTTISEDVLRTMRKRNLTKASERLELLLTRTIELCMMNSGLMHAVLEYLNAQARQGENVERKLNRHTIFFRRAIRNLLYEGIQVGEFRTMDVQAGEDLIFSLFQAIALRIMLYNNPQLDSLVQHCRNLIQYMKKDPAK